MILLEGVLRVLWSIPKQVGMDFFWPEAMTGRGEATTFLHLVSRRQRPQPLVRDENLCHSPSRDSLLYKRPTDLLR